MVVDIAKTIRTAFKECLEDTPWEVLASGAADEIERLRAARKEQDKRIDYLVECCTAKDKRIEELEVADG